MMDKNKSKYQVGREIYYAGNILIKCFQRSERGESKSTEEVGVSFII